ncbi:MAG: hypothetical protein Q7V05_00305 [Methanoregula sp.]|nr:hypothetical protein [Methanoregula sp.]
MDTGSGTFASTSHLHDGKRDPELFSYVQIAARFHTDPPPLRDRLRTTRISHAIFLKTPGTH